MTSTLAAVPLPTTRRPRLRRVRYEPGSCDATRPDPTVPVPPDPSPRRPQVTTPEFAEAHRRVTHTLRIILEVLDGRRSPAHLTGRLDEPVLRYWRAAAERRRVRSPARFSRIRLCLPHPGVAEVAVTCDIDGRVRALAARFERGGPDGWRCTALRLG